MTLLGLAILIVSILLGLAVFSAGVFASNERDRKRTKQYKIKFKKYE